MALQPCVGRNQPFNQAEMERVLLDLGDAFDIRVGWSRAAETSVVTSACAVAGGLVGGYAGGRLGAALGAGIAGVAGYQVATHVSLREVWVMVQHQLQELVYIVFNFLRRLDAADCVHAVDLALASRGSRRELALTLVEFLAIKLGREVLCNLVTAG